MGTVDTPTNEHTVVQGLDGVDRDYALHLPLVTDLERLEIGVEPGARFELLPLPTERPVVYYVTSIIHGAAASRPRTSVLAQLGRRLGRPDGDRAGPPSRRGRRGAARRGLPAQHGRGPGHRAGAAVRLVEDRTVANAWARPETAERHRSSRAALTTAHRDLDDPGVHYLPGDGLLGADADDTIDGSHPTDLGFRRMTEVLVPVLNALLDR